MKMIWRKRVITIQKQPTLSPSVFAMLHWKKSYHLWGVVVSHRYCTSCIFFREMGVVNQFLQLASGKQSLLHVVKTEKVSCLRNFIVAGPYGKCNLSDPPVLETVWCLIMDLRMPAKCPGLRWTRKAFSRLCIGRRALKFITSCHSYLTRVWNLFCI